MVAKLTSFKGIIGIFSPLKRQFLNLSKLEVRSGHSNHSHRKGGWNCGLDPWA